MCLLLTFDKILTFLVWKVGVLDLLASAESYSEALSLRLEPSVEDVGFEQIRVVDTAGLLGAFALAVSDCSSVWLVPDHLTS